MSRTKEKLNQDLEQIRGESYKNLKKCVFAILSANDTIEEAKKQPDPKPLYKNLFYQGEVCILFADTNGGKSLLAVQMADHIAREFGLVVLYIDFELSRKQFQIRYTDEKTGETHKFADGFYRVDVQLENIEDNYINQVMDGIKDLIDNTGAKILIIDNITYLCDDCEKGDQASRFMKTLVEIKKLKNVSLLVVAHTPKRLMTLPITQNDLAGSKKIANFCDSIFAIGSSANNSNVRYIKQIKSRNCAKIYDQDNVLVYEIVKEHAFLHFKEIGTDKEINHLRSFDDFSKNEISQTVADLTKRGMSVREIGKQLGLSGTTINNIQHQINFGEDAKQ